MIACIGGAFHLRPRRLPQQSERAATPRERPFQLCARDEVLRRFEVALAESDGVTGAHCIHELWMRGEWPGNIEKGLETLWKHAAKSIPEWLPMRYIDWLPVAYEVTGEFRAAFKGRTNIYLVLLDYSDSRSQPHGVYVGMSHYSPADRFDQHKAGIRASGSVLKRGLEVLTGPTLHLQYISRGEAARIEEQLAGALSAAGLFVQGGH
jgi:hypothetical protein